MPATRSLVLAGLLATSFLTLPASADAFTRYAAPGSAVTTGACDQPSPGCRLDYAINQAGNNDTVIVQTGDYNVTWPILATQLINVEGEAGQPRPRLLGGAALTGATVNLPKGGSIKHVYVESTSGSSALSTKQVAVSDVIAYATSSDAADAKAGSGSVIRDSIFYTTAGTPYSALKLWDNQVTGPIDIVNVTAYGSTAGSNGIQNGAGGPVTIVNTIARGGTNDITLTSGVASASVSYTNFRSAASSGVTEGLGNQPTAPVFANAAAGDFHPAAGSPTIDAGNSGITLQADPDGIARGIAPDIGAFEYVGAGGGAGGAGGGGTGPTDPATADPATVDPGTTGPGTTDPGKTDPGKTDPGKTDPPATDSGAGGGSLPPAAPPVLGQSVGLGPVKGTVTVLLPGSASPVALEQGASVPVGSIVDATAGTVSLTSVRDRAGKTQTGKFWGGPFRVTQNRRDAYTELKLVGQTPSCSTRDRLTAAGRRGKRLWGRDRGGRFRTRGRHASATVRGTEWLTEDRCDGTFFRVKNGKIVVRDAHRRKNVKLGRGDSYLARARAAKRR